jgi:hypothetical protein
MRLEFTLRDLPGSVDVVLEPNDDPEALGCRPWGRGFPVCTAKVAYAGRGYAAALGWMQLVHSTDDASARAAFEPDPYEPLGQLSHPFCWFGFAPTLFDAPSRRSRPDMEWTAHSFLGFIGAPREARAILGFSWGFAVREGDVTIGRATPLEAAEWDAHMFVLRGTHPTWQFAAGYRDR